MGLIAGIVGLPKVGKSTIFNALTTPGRSTSTSSWGSSSPRRSGGGELVTLGSEQAARAAERMCNEGWNYVVQDGDVILFRFNV